MLSVIFHPLWPLAITSLLVSLGVCVAAAPQAALPETKRRWWSRPLVAMLFFLQPIVRGWARYRGRLLRAGPPPLAAASRRSIPSPCATASNRCGEVQYWAEQRLDRLALVADILRRLDQQGWPSTSRHRLERLRRGDLRHPLEQAAAHHGRRRASPGQATDPLPPALALVAAGEGWPSGRCAGSSLLVCGLVGHHRPWLWLVLLTLPLFAWFLHREQRNLQSMIAVFLDELAKEWHLTKVQPAERPPTGAGTANPSADCVRGTNAVACSQPLL